MSAFLTSADFQGARLQEVGPPRAYSLRSGALLLWAIPFSVAILLCTGSRAVADDEMLSVIRSGYRESISKLNTVYARLEKTTELIADANSIPAIAGIQLPQGTHVIEWALDGPRRMYQIGPVSDGSNRLRVFQSSDGKESWSVQWAHDSSEPMRIFREADRTGSDAWFRIHRAPGHYLGFYPDIGHAIRSSSLEQLLTDGPVHVENQEVVDGHACWRLCFGPYKGMPDGESARFQHLSVWFDAEVAYLPRRFVYWSTIDGDMSAPREHPTTHHISAFRKIAEVDGWFPESMVTETWLARETMRLLELRVNEQLPVDLFRPDADLRVNIVNLSDRRSRDEYDRILIADNRVREQSELGATAKAVVWDAKPPLVGTSARRWFLLIAGLLALISLIVSLRHFVRGRSRGRADGRS